MRLKMNESDITLGFSEYLDGNGWEIVSVHPPGGHTSFSLLDGRRSLGAYMPDIVAIQKGYTKKEACFVLIIETKMYFNQSDEDILKLKNLSNTHAAWTAFRLQNHINREQFEKNWKELLQKVVLVGSGLDSVTKDLLNTEIVFIEFDANKKKIKKILYGKNSPILKSKKSIPSLFKK